MQQLSLFDFGEEPPKPEKKKKAPIKGENPRVEPSENGDAFGIPKPPDSVISDSGVDPNSAANLEINDNNESSAPIPPAVDDIIDNAQPDLNEYPMQQQEQLGDIQEDQPELADDYTDDQLDTSFAPESEDNENEITANIAEPSVSHSEVVPEPVQQSATPDHTAQKADATQEAATVPTSSIGHDQEKEKGKDDDIVFSNEKIVVKYKLKGDNVPNLENKDAEITESDNSQKQAQATENTEQPELSSAQQVEETESQQPTSSIIQTPISEEEQEDGIRTLDTSFPPAEPNENEKAVNGASGDLANQEPDITLNETQAQKGEEAESVPNPVRRTTSEEPVQEVAPNATTYDSNVDHAELSARLAATEIENKAEIESDSPTQKEIQAQEEVPATGPIEPNDKEDQDPIPDLDLAGESTPSFDVPKVAEEATEQKDANPGVSLKNGPLLPPGNIYAGSISIVEADIQPIPIKQQIGTEIPKSTQLDENINAEKKVEPETSSISPAKAKSEDYTPPIRKRGRKSFKEIDAEVDLIDVPSDEELYKKQYYPISVVAKWFRVNNSLLRFWENEFKILKPKKNKKGDRFFRPEDVKNLQLIYYLLRQKKLTINGAIKHLKANKEHTEVNLQLIQTLNEFKGFLLELKLAAEK
ncbi:MAG TPA: MerR family transcriptional regulator [Arachidicoccus sp.]|nr:MerR family transcriptional regulator [Arachidicoccus sp.]